MKVVRWLALLVGCLFLAAGCNSVLPPTPIVIRDTRSDQTATAAALPTRTPSEPSPTPTATSTPYIRPTDAPTLDLALPLVTVGDETITLGDFRARVRYERFAALDNVRRAVQTLGLKAFDLSQPGANRPADFVAGIFNTLANSDAFGAQIYDILLREAVIRQEFARRGLTLPSDDVRAYWIRRFELQRDPNAAESVQAPLAAYRAEAVRYSGLTVKQIDSVAESFVMATMLKPIIVRELGETPRLESFNAKRIIARSESDARAALDLIKTGGDFRAGACRYSIDAAARGTGGDTGFLTRAVLTFPGAERLFGAEVGAAVGVFQTPLGWQVYHITEKRTNADGDAQIRAAVITVSGENVAADILKRAQGGEDFGSLVCQYSLTTGGGLGGELGRVGVEVFAPEVARAVQAGGAETLFGPLETAAGWEVVQITDRQLDIPQPEELDKAADRAFSRWQTQKIASAYVTQHSDVWRAAVPRDPLPREVAPYLTEENFGLPTPPPTSTATRISTP